MSKRLKPDIWLDDVYAIDIDSLLARGIDTIFFDIDNTLIEYSDRKSNEELNEWLGLLFEKGFKLGFLSNAKDERIYSFASEIIVRGKRLTDYDAFKVTGNAMKPLKSGFARLAKKTNSKKEEIAMVGDQLYTDILGGNLYGAYTILVDPINRADEFWFVAFKRIFEKRHLKKFKKS